VTKDLAGHGSILAHTCVAFRLRSDNYFRKESDMQDSSDQETTFDTTRAGGPDDTRALETSNKEEEGEQEVSTEEKDAGWR
jgi:hypothetical protein